MKDHVSTTTTSVNERTDLPQPRPFNERTELPQLSYETPTSTSSSDPTTPFHHPQPRHHLSMKDHVSTPIILKTAYIDVSIIPSYTITTFR